MLESACSVPVPESSNAYLILDPGEHHLLLLLMVVKKKGGPRLLAGGVNLIAGAVTSNWLQLGFRNGREQKRSSAVFMHIRRTQFVFFCHLSNLCYINTSVSHSFCNNCIHCT